MTTRFTRRWVGLATAALMIGSATGCGAGDRTGDTSGITVVLSGNAEEIAGYRSLVAAFEEANTDIRVTLSPVATQDELMARLTTSFAGGKAPDVFLMNYRRYGQFAAQKAIEPVQSYLDGSKVLNEKDLSPRALDAFRFDGDALTCLPQNMSSLVVYYNAGLFAKAGVPLPKPGWSWADFLTTARALTRDETYGAGVAPSIARIAPFVWSAGGELVDAPDQPTALTFTGNAATRKALDWFLDLQLVHHVVPPDAEEQSESSEARFLRGGLGMYLNSRVAVPTLRTIKGFEWDAAPLPVAPGGAPASILHSDAYCMSAGRPDHTDAWRFIEFAMGVAGQEILAESGRTVPSRLDVANSPAFLAGNQPPRSANIFLDAEPYLRTTPRTANWSRVERETDKLLEEVFYGRVPREEGLRQLEDQIRPLFALGVGTGR